MNSNRKDKRLWSMVLAAVISLGSMGAQGDADTQPSPGLEWYPHTALQSLNECLTSGASTVEPTRTARHRVTRYVAEWFDAFRKPTYAELFDRLRDSSDSNYQTVQRTVAIYIDDVRRLTDFRTEQALISVMDAAVRQRSSGTACRRVVARLMLGMAAQRDRAWAWANAMERVLEMDRNRRRAELQSHRVVDALRDVERSYQDLMPYLD